MRTIESALPETTAAQSTLTERDLPRGIWLAPILGMLAYPLLVKSLFICANLPSVMGAIGAVVSALLALAMPGIALWSLLTLRKSTLPGIRWTRLTLHLAVSAPPLYLLSGLPAAILVLTFVDTSQGFSEQQFDLLLQARDALWWGIWTIVGLFMAFAPRSAKRARGEKSSVIENRSGRTASTLRLRAIHRTALLLIVVAFLALHLGSHLLALWSSDAQDHAMTTLRLWYRAPSIEPVILTIFAVGAIVGLRLAIRWTRSPGNAYRVIQTCSGFYLAFFLVNHLLAVFRHRGSGGDTNWAFATGGESGMLGTEPYVAVFLYYVLAVLLVGVHLGVGLRALSLARGRSRQFADRCFEIASVSGTVMAGLTAAALLGVRLSDFFL